MDTNKTNECTEEEMFDDIWQEFTESDKLDQAKIKKFKHDFKNQLKGLIHVEELWVYLDEMDSWMPEEIVDIVLTEEKERDFPNHQCARIVADTDKVLYMKTDADAEIEGIDYYYVWQRTGYLEDDYYGFLLFPLKDGKYFKISYGC